jgi:hypothetical protein
MPKSAFIREHKKLIALLNSSSDPRFRREASEQAAELKRVADDMVGASKASGFIQRMMWEVQNKHDGEYKGPTWPLAEDSTMNKPARFSYKAIANKAQSGRTSSKYGASPFIQRHFGLTGEVVPGVRTRVAKPVETGAVTEDTKAARDAAMQRLLKKGMRHISPMDLGMEMMKAQKSKKAKKPATAAAPAKPKRVPPALAAMVAAAPAPKPAAPAAPEPTTAEEADAELEEMVKAARPIAAVKKEFLSRLSKEKGLGDTIRYIIPLSAAERERNTRNAGMKQTIPLTPTAIDNVFGKDKRAGLGEAIDSLTGRHGKREVVVQLTPNKGKDVSHPGSIVISLYRPGSLK